MCALIRLLLGTLVSALIFYATPVWSQQQSDFEKDKAAAYAQFAQGRLQESIKILQSLIPKAPTPLAAASLQRDLIEICSTGYFFKCYSDANQALFAALQSDKELSSLYPELMLYVVRERLWSNDKEFIKQILDKGGAPSYVNPSRSPGTYAEMQLLLNSVHVSKSDLKTAEESISSAIMGLLLSDPSQTYRTSKILVGLLAALLSEQDIVGAFQLLAVIDPYVSKQLSHDSVLYADYILYVGQLFAFTNNHSTTIATLSTAAKLFKTLDIAPEVRDFKSSIAISLGAAALAIAENLDKSNKLHAQNPMQQQKEATIKRGSFQNLSEFYFAVVDVFLSGLAKTPADNRWKALFQKEPTWDLGDYVTSVINSYRSFALAILELGNGARPDATRLFIDAAEKRIAVFEAFQRTNFEGFQLPGLVDKIIIGAALQFAAESSSPEAANLMLRGGEILLRDLRQSISDEAVLLASQPSKKSRKNAHAYINLVRQKRDWELKTISQWLKAPDPNIKGAMISEYTSVVTTLSKLKSEFVSHSNFVKANGLPSVAEIQGALSASEVFITYFPMPIGFGRLCIDKKTSTYRFGTFDQSSVNHARLLEFATTATYGADPRLDSQYPVESAIYIKNLLFGGLEQCMKPGSHVIVSLPRELSGVPVAALLSEAPPRLGDGYDLKRARWLIRDFSFSFVISARQYLAVVANVPRARAPLEYLGVGDPQLDRMNSAQIASALSIVERRVGTNTDFALKEIPDAANELRAVAAVFDKGKQDVLLRQGSTEEAFRLKALGDYDVIHFATHGMFSQDSKGLSESALILTPGASSDLFDDGILSASEISRLSLQARLVVLSACNSAKFNQQQANLGVHDLQAAFTVAGAPTILAALWSIESVTAKDLMVRFFENWRSGQFRGAAPSLAQTIRSYLDHSDRSHQHPRFWAPFEIFGNGSITGKPIEKTSWTADTSKPLGALKLFSEFKSGGEIIDSAALGSDVILSVMAEWDGKRMAGIIIDRNSQGKEKWRVTSREIGASKVAVLDDQIFALGLKGVDHFTPGIRSFDSLGHQLWSKEYSDLIDYSFTDLTPSKSSMLVIAYPQFSRVGSPDENAFLLNIDRSGNEIRRTSFKIDTSRVSTVGAPALVRVIGDQVIIAVNKGSSIRMNPNRRNVLGLPSVCFEGSSVNLFYFSLGDFRLKTSASINNFQITEAAIWKSELYIGGQSLDNCSQKGSAAVRKIRPNGASDEFWKDDDIFPSVVQGMAIKDDLYIGVNYERAVGINVVKPVNLAGYENKRWGDDNMAIREASLLELSSNGKIHFRKDFSAGISVYLHGVTVINGEPIVYGSLGGEPASTLH